MNGGNKKRGNSTTKESQISNEPPKGRGKAKTQKA